VIIPEQNSLTLTITPDIVQYELLRLFWDWHRLEVDMALLLRYWRSDCYSFVELATYRTISKE
jgi:hypothetical protein